MPRIRQAVELRALIQSHGIRRSDRRAVITDRGNIAASTCAGLLLLAACSSNPCSGHQFDRLKRYSRPYAGRWVVTHGDTLTFPDAPQVSDRFRIREIELDTTATIVGRQCVFRGRMTFRAPRADTIAVTWFGQPEQAIVSGWPAALGPFAGVSLAWAGRDSLRGSVLFDSKLGVQSRPGMTAQFMAGQLSSQP